MSNYEPGCNGELPVAPEQQTEHQRGWHLLGRRINSFQAESIRKLVKRAKAAHFVDVLVRINGENEIYEGDWIKHLEETPTMRSWWRRPWCALDNHGGIGADSRCKRCGAMVKVSPW